LLGALAAFAAGACAGIFLAFRHFVRKRLPAWVALLHGIGGATGFALVLLFVVREPGFAAARHALYLFIATIALGSVNLLFHLRRKRHRTSLILVHALTAVSGVGTLIYSIFTFAPGAPAEASAGPPASAPAASSPADPAAGAPVSGSTASPGTSASSDESSAVATQALPSATPPAPGRDALSKLDADARRVLNASIGFGPNGDRILAESAESLNEMARVLNEHPEIQRVEVQGHSDRRGTDAHNVRLSLRRAITVGAALSALGVDARRLQPAGYGARCPSDPPCGGGDDAPPHCGDSTHLKADRRVSLLPLEIGNEPYSGPVTCAAGEPLIPAEDRKFHTPR
jgi:outer membrane protein OmpA-like peptidoglycan-associated protein